MDILSRFDQTFFPGGRVRRLDGWDALKKFPMPRDCEGMFLDVDDSKDYLYMKKTYPDGAEKCARYKLVLDMPEEFDPHNYVNVRDFNEFREEIRNGFNSIKQQLSSATANTKPDAPAGKPDGQREQHYQSDHGFTKSDSSISANGRQQPGSSERDEFD